MWNLDQVPDFSEHVSISLKKKILDDSTELGTRREQAIDISHALTHLVLWTAHTCQHCCFPHLTGEDLEAQIANLLAGDHTARGWWSGFGAWVVCLWRPLKKQPTPHLQEGQSVPLAAELKKLLGLHFSIVPTPGTRTLGKGDCPCVSLVPLQP